MALEAPTTPPFYSPWPDRLRQAAIILLVAAFGLAVLVILGELSPLRASVVFACIAAASLVLFVIAAILAKGPWTLIAIAVLFALALQRMQRFSRHYAMELFIQFLQVEKGP